MVIAHLITQIGKCLWVLVGICVLNQLAVFTENVRIARLINKVFVEYAVRVC